jgi:hypothetical protein
VVRDALLDHVALVVTPADGEPVDVSQRLVQAISRMGFLGPANGPAGGPANRPAGGPAGVDGADGPDIRVCVAGRWVGLSAPYGVAWLQPVKDLTVMPIGGRPLG